MQCLAEGKSSVQDELELSQYLCKKQGEDLKIVRQEINNLQKSMVSITRCPSMKSCEADKDVQNCDPFVLVLIDGDITMVRFASETIMCSSHIVWRRIRTTGVLWRP